MSRILFSGFSLLLILSGCMADRQVSRSFYYWKPEFHLDAESSQLLNTLQSNRIYLHCFDVKWDVDKSKPYLLNKVVVLKDSQLAQLDIVPVVFLSANCMTQIKANQLKELSDLILSQISDISMNAGFSWHEIQFDCDWNELNKDQYFGLLNFIKSNLNPIDQRLSCTIRLHQIKYPDVSGVPPVDRGMLLYYNMSKINEPGTRNSIYDPEVAARYVSYVKDYRLPLDIALPVFSWGVHQRDNEVIAVINDMNLAETKASNLFDEKAKGLFAPKFQCTFKGVNFLETDRLRVEEISPNRSLQAAQQIKPFLNDVNLNVALFQLDSANTARYGEEAFEELYSVFD
jgi:hypothetical protein